MTKQTRIIEHRTERIPDTGSFEVRTSVYFYYDENPGRRSISKTTQTDRAGAMEAAKEFARKEREKKE